jgi:glycosyltransferase involved in cell wall biosynthesis
MEKIGLNDNDLDILFVGGLFPAKLTDEIIRKSKNNVQTAANNFQWNLVNGFDENLSSPITILNEMFIGGFPKNYQDFIIEGGEFSHTQGACDLNLGFVNISGLKQMLRPFGEKEYLKDWALSTRRKHKVVIIYSLNPRFIRIVRDLKRYDKNILIYITVNDLPKYIMMGKIGVIKKVWKKINNSRVLKAVDGLDGYILITEQMKEYLNIEGKPYVVVEGLVNVDALDHDLILNHPNTIKKIVYTGTLTRAYGIEHLLDSFSAIEGNDYRLVICGSGEMASVIESRAKTDNRIEYLGVRNPSEVRKIQQEASVLVNPRQDGDTYTGYSFPIKTLEYLFAGPPVLCYKLKGIPNEYDDYLVYMNDNSVDTLKMKIIEMCGISASERETIRKRNIDFVKNNKSNKHQTGKILAMIVKQITQHPKYVSHSDDIQDQRKEG